MESKMASVSEAVVTDGFGSNSYPGKRKDSGNVKLSERAVMYSVGNDPPTYSQDTSTSEDDEKPVTKNKPPPIDVSAAQHYHNQNMSTPRTPSSSSPYTPSLPLDRRKEKEKKIGHRRVDEEGQITYKKIQTSQIMGSIQLGIGYAVGSLASTPGRDLLMQDFAIVETTVFPRDGTSNTPAHHFSDFRFKAYAPVAFRYFRDLFGIRPDDFLLSMCNDPMRELTNPGASGSIFYLTNDDEFIIKTVQHKEAEFLQKLLPGYYMNLNQNPRTLLPKFFGLYCYQYGGKNIRLCVMNNLLPSTIKLHHKYDLKGSTYKRKASKYERNKESPTFKDLDFIEHYQDGIQLEADTYSALIKTIQRDCRVLESFKIMDYSLLLGIYNLDLQKRERMEKLLRNDEGIDSSYIGISRIPTSASDSGAGTFEDGGKGESKLTRSKSINKQRLAAFSTALESIQAEPDVIENDDDVPSGGIPARNSKGDRLLLFIGIIDILQSFRLKKKLEHTWKSVLHDGDTVSVHRPSFYAQRFQEFMAKTVFKKVPSSLKHSPSKKKGLALRRPTSGETELAKPASLLIKSQSDSEAFHSSEVTSVDFCGPVIIPPSPSDHPSSEFDKELWSKDITNLAKTRANTDPVPMKTVHTGHVSKTYSVNLDRSEVISLSQVTIQTESTGSVLSETSSSTTSGFASTLPTSTCTPPRSVEGSTPTHTEGTPSFTESSSSGDAACPTTPVKYSTSQPFETLPPLGETQIYQESEIKSFASLWMGHSY